MSVAAIVQFSISRLLGRLIVQLSQIISRVLWPELLHKTADESRGLANKAIFSFLMVSLPSLTLIVVVAAMLDGRTFKGVEFEFLLAAILSIGAFFIAFNDVLLSVLVSVEKHFYPTLIRCLGLIMTFALLMLFSVDEVVLIALMMLFFEIVIVTISIIFYRLNFKS